MRWPAALSKGRDNCNELMLRLLQKSRDETVIICAAHGTLHTEPCPGAAGYTVVHK